MDDLKNHFRPNSLVLQGFTTLNGLVKPANRQPEKRPTFPGIAQHSTLEQTKEGIPATQLPKWLGGTSQGVSAQKLIEVSPHILSLGR